MGQLLSTVQSACTRMPSLADQKASPEGNNNAPVAHQEPLLADSPSRFVIRPNRDTDLWQLYKKAQSCYWVAEEIKLKQDIEDWKTLSSGERRFLEAVLAFFAASDGIVNENLLERFSREVKMTEARHFYAYQIANEAVHAETYSMLIEALVPSRKKQDRLFNAIANNVFIKRKADWALAWIHSDTATFGERLVAFAIVEGVFFSGSFAAIFWFKNSGKMPGLCASNEFISRDEGLHRDFAFLLYSDYLVDKPSEASVKKMIDEAVSIERSFFSDALPCSMLGMNARSMSQYVEYVADHLLDKMGLSPLYEVANPFAFMVNISLPGKTNMFERQVTEYKKPNDFVDPAAEDFVLNADV